MTSSRTLAAAENSEAAVCSGARRAERDDGATAGTLLELLEFTPALTRPLRRGESRHISEVHTLEELTPLPWRSGFHPRHREPARSHPAVLDLKKFFELPEQGPHRPAPDHRACAATISSSVCSPTRWSGWRSARRSRLLQPSLPTLTGIRADYLKGVSDERLVVLDLDRVLSDPKIVVQRRRGLSGETNEVERGDQDHRRASASSSSSS